MERVSAHDLARAEELYREALAIASESREARLGLARVLMWRLRVDEAEAHFRRILDENPSDIEAREGIATIAYWRGDHAGAARQLQEILRDDPGRASARETLTEIERAFEPSYRAEVSLLDDDQPYDRLTSRFAAGFRPYPALLLRTVATFEQFETGSRRDEGLALAVTAETYSHALESRVAVSFEPMRFPNGETALLGNLAFVKRLIRSQSSLTARVARDDILATSAAVERKATVTAGTLSWQIDRQDGWLGGAEALAQRYFDGNEGYSANAYLLAPVLRNGRTRAWGGVALAYRDTEESRFGLRQFRSEPRPAGGFHYVYEGVYDPYWTPHDLSEGRLVLAAEHQWTSWNGKIHLDGGIARDDAVGFGPSAGDSPLPPSIGTARFPREFHPWRIFASINGTLGSLQVEIGYERSSTVFYKANEYRASVAGRL